MIMDELIYKMKSIRLSAMTANLTVRVQEATANELSYLEFLQNLIDDEISTRRDRLLSKRLKQAKLPFMKTLDDFDFGFNPSINRQQIKHLATSAFVANHENILMIGPPGVGKTHLVTAFSIEAIHKGFSVLYRSVFDLAADIAKNHDQVINHFLKSDLLLIDELGMKNMNSHANEIILEVIHRRYQRNSTVIATNRPIEDWGKIFGDNATASAILDRFLENVHLLKITGKSYRLKNLKSEEQKMVDSNM
jgi:DNA replication protein DnaC